MISLHAEVQHKKQVKKHARTETNFGLICQRREWHGSVAGSVRSTFRASRAHIRMTLFVKTAKNEIAPNRTMLKFMLDEMVLSI